MDQQEIQGLKLFLKRLSNEYYDMELLSRGIQDEKLSSEAVAMAKKFRLVIRECDDAASAGDLKKIIELYPQTSELLNKYFSYLQDVPDEV